MITSNFSAEYGRVGGAVVNSVMRSGTNQFHGALSNFSRNTDLNAIGYIFGARPNVQKTDASEKPAWGQHRRATHQEQVFLPITKDSAIWFAS